MQNRVITLIVESGCRLPNLKREIQILIKLVHNDQQLKNKAIEEKKTIIFKNNNQAINHIKLYSHLVQNHQNTKVLKKKLMNYIIKHNFSLYKLLKIS